MSSISEENWYKEALRIYIDTYGDVPPPWVFAENSHPYSMRWRMGAGETLLMVFYEQFKVCKTEQDRINYFKKWPPPPRWIAWMADAIWDLESWEGGGKFDYQPYFDKLNDHGFTGMDEYEADLDDEKWLKLDF